MRTLNPLELPLSGLTLIEASAGTGKTYTIATLYLRLLLHRGLMVDQILVVTFTKAATEELRDRVRRQLVVALDWLRGDADGSADPVLAKLLGALPDRQAAMDSLSSALARMDEAAIYTIHGFCQRMLQDQALESGVDFELEFISDESGLRQMAVEDFWRRKVAVADGPWARRRYQQWKLPGDVLDAIGDTLSLDELLIQPPPDADAVARAADALVTTFGQLRKVWKDKRDAVEKILQQDLAINRQSYRKPIVLRALANLQDFLDADSMTDELPEDFFRFTPAVLREKGTKLGHDTPRHSLFDLCGRLAELHAEYKRSVRVALFCEARDDVRAALARGKREQALLYFDDLLKGLDQALAGDTGAALAQVIRQRFPVALVDEFQDTDSQQYRIFRRIYRGQKACGLFLIGDPKQAIYAFRGADIFTYMAAREDSQREGQCYTLGVNWRSGSGLVAAVNRLFGAASKPFVYDEHIPFQPVAAAPDADAAPLVLADGPPPPMQFWLLPLTEDNETPRPRGYIRRDSAAEAAASACAGHIAGLLSQADAGKARLGERPLQSADIAVLVRSHREGERMRDALRACGVSSVTLSQDSIFASEDAAELAILLQALGDISDERRLRAALATSLLGRTAEELDRLANDEVAWEALLAQFQGYRDHWLERGFMAALQLLIEEQAIARRLARRPDGERRLGNLLQLLELLQVASTEHPGCEALLRWFADQRAEGRGGDAEQLRLESDEGLVRIVTMHKSKGLEYPVVFIPFPWSGFSSSNKGDKVLYHDEQGRICLDLGTPEQEHHRLSGDRERLAERLRLFYVAVTRAARLCIMCWGKVNGAGESAPAYLLHPPAAGDASVSRFDGMTAEQIRADLNRLAQQQPGCIAVLDLQDVGEVRWSGPQVHRDDLSPASFRGRIDASWRLTSYSGLVRDADSERPDYDAVAVSVSQESPPTATADALFELPAGAHVGHLLHEIFEHLDFPQARGEPLASTVRAALQRYVQLAAGQPGREPDRDWTPVVTELVGNALDTPLDAEGSLRLRDIGAADRIAEMEFHFPLQGLDPQGLSAVLDSDPRYRGSATGLEFKPMRGLMRGFIDLLFRHQGRYYLLDYKSNLLGRELSAYRQAELQRAIRSHRYDLQYLIYTLALHRFLRRRLRDYDYGRHFGGVYYLFLRGMRPASGATCGVWHDRPDRAIIEDLDGYFGSDGGRH